LESEEAKQEIADEKEEAEAAAAAKLPTIEAPSSVEVEVDKVSTAAAVVDDDDHSDV